MNTKEVGQNIAKHRKAKKLTQAQLGEKLQVSHKMISRWETGYTMPDLSYLIPLSEELDISLYELLNPEAAEREEAETVTLPAQEEREKSQAIISYSQHILFSQKKRNLFIILAILLISFAVIFSLMKSIQHHKALEEEMLAQLQEDAESSGHFSASLGLSSHLFNEKEDTLKQSLYTIFVWKEKDNTLDYSEFESIGTAEEICSALHYTLVPIKDQEEGAVECINNQIPVICHIRYDNEELYLPVNGYSMNRSSVRLIFIQFTGMTYMKYENIQILEAFSIRKIN